MISRAFIRYQWATRETERRNLNRLRNTILPTALHYRLVCFSEKNPRDVLTDSVLQNTLIAGRVRLFDLSARGFVMRKVL